nr:MAG TPA: helix-turn-helix domain protein [Caudoviricetes sp.]
MREYLIRARTKAGLTQAQAAKKLLISQNYLSDIETGKRQKDLKLNVLKGCAKVYEVPLDTLIYGESEYQERKEE